MSKKDNLLAIDYVKSASVGGSSRVVGSGSGGTVDTSGFLLLDGSRAMTGNFDVGGFNISNVNLVDGIDIAAHAANPNAHHARQHSYDSTSDHSGTLSWTNVNKSGSNLTDIETRTHNSLQSIGENDHHNRQHSITSASDHTVTGSNFDLVGLNATNTLGILTPSANVSSGIERILKSNSAGNLNLASLTTTLINSGSGATLEIAPGNYLVLNPAGFLIQLTSGRAIQSDNYSSQTTGMRIDHLGGGDFRYLYTDEMHAKTFIADLEQALAGGQIISKSVAILNQNFTAPPDTGTIGERTTTLVVEDLPGTTAMAVFQNGDIVRLRNFSRASGSLSITDCWGSVTLDTTYGTSGFLNGTQRYSFVRSTSPNGGAMTSGTTVEANTLVLDYGTTGNGYYEVNAIDGAYAINSPYAQVVTWTSHPATGKTTRARLGNLVGIFGGSNEYGLYAGDGGTSTSSQYLRISNSGVGLFNVPLRMYTGGTETVHIGGYNDVWLGPNSSNKLLSFDGSTLSIVGDITVTGGNAATTSNVAGGSNICSNSSFEIDSNSDGLADGFAIYNNDGGAVPTTASIVPGLRSRYAQRISWTGTNASTKGIYFNSYAPKIASKYYVLSFWARCSASTNINFYEDVPAATTKTWLTSQSMSGTWAFYAIRLYWSSTPADNFHLSVTNGQAISDGYIDFDNIMLTESYDIVPYYPAFGDILTYGGRVSIPSNPTTTGLYINKDYMGYWNSSTGWRTYMDANGTFTFAGSGGAYLVWDGTRLFSDTSSTFNSATAAWYINSSNGAFTAANGSIVINSGGIMIGTSTIGSSTEYLQFNSGELAIGVSTSFGGYRTSSIYAKYSTSNQVALLVRNAGDANAANYNAGIFVRQVSYAGSILLQASNIYLSTPVGGSTAVSLTGTLTSTGTITAPTITASTSFTGASITLSGSAVVSSITSGNIVSSSTITTQYLVVANNATALGPWSNATFVSGWSNYGSGYQSVQYRRFGDTVSVRGMAYTASGGVANVITLPYTFAAKYRYFLSGSWSTTVVVDIQTNGTITIVSSGATAGSILSLNIADIPLY